MTRTNRRLIFSVLALTLGTAGTLLSGPAHIFDLVKLIAESDIIVEGQVLSTAQKDTLKISVNGYDIPAVRYQGSIQVRKEIKGAIPSAAVDVEFFIPDAPTGMQGVKGGEYGIFFLKKGALLFQFSDPMYPMLPAVSNDEVSSGPPLDVITIEMGRVLDTPASDSDFQRALGALGGLETELSRQVLRRSLETSSKNARLRIAATLVARNDVTGLSTVEKALLSPASLPQDTISILAGSLQGLRNPEAIPALTRLAAVSNRDVRRGAAAGLRQSGSRRALVPLATLLEGTDESTLYYAVAGMGEITRQDEWTPSYEEFRLHKGRYLSYWRAWASQNVTYGASAREPSAK